MNPAYSVIFLTTLIGVGQGLFTAIALGQIISQIGLIPIETKNFYIATSILSLIFLIGGLIASFFHLGHPERAWRAVTMWRTSWLSREVIVLPILMLVMTLYAVAHHYQWGISNATTITTKTIDISLMIGMLGIFISFILFFCTGMIYACIKFLQEWATPLTVINYTLLGLSSGSLLAISICVYFESNQTNFYIVLFVSLLVTALITRTASLFRNKKLKPRSNLQSAIGVHHQKISQKSQGFMGGSFNTRDFFHGVKPIYFRALKWIFLILVFLVPLLMLWFAYFEGSLLILVLAFLIQYLGLIIERWYFFAQANHPQNLYYSKIS